MLRIDLWHKLCNHAVKQPATRISLVSCECRVKNRHFLSLSRAPIRGFVPHTQPRNHTATVDAEKRSKTGILLVRCYILLCVCATYSSYNCRRDCVSRSPQIAENRAGNSATKLHEQHSTLSGQRNISHIAIIRDDDGGLKKDREQEKRKKLFLWRFAKEKPRTKKTHRRRSSAKVK